jgi:hypothetical protein
MLRALLVTMLVVGFSGEAAAQAGPAPPDNRCWHSSQSYSAGSLVRVGGKFYACGDAARWEAAESGGANCVYEDRNFSSGAVVAVRDRLIACQPSGAWEVVPAE